MTLDQIMDRERDTLVRDAVAIRSALDGAWLRHDGEKWIAMRIGEGIQFGEGRTVSEALEGMEVEA